MVLSNVLFTQKNEDRTWPKDTLFLHQVGGKPLRFTLHPASLTHKQWADRDQPTIIVRSIHFARMDISFMIKIPYCSGLPKALQLASAFLKALSRKQG